MAHVGQKLALRAAGTFGQMFGFLQGFVAGLQFGGVASQLFLGQLAIVDVSNRQQHMSRAIEPYRRDVGEEPGAFGIRH